MNKGKVRLDPPTGHAQSYWYVMDTRNNSIVYFTFPPTEVSENPGSPRYDSKSVVGRSAPLLSYSYNDSRSISVSAEFVDDYTDKELSDIRDALSAMQYPIYSTSGAIIPPGVQCRVGKDIIVRGVMQNLSVTWTDNIRNNSYIRLKVSFTVTECRSIPLSASDVKSGGFNG